MVVMVVFIAKAYLYTSTFVFIKTMITP